MFYKPWFWKLSKHEQAKELTSDYLKSFSNYLLQTKNMESQFVISMINRKNKQKFITLTLNEFNTHDNLHFMIPINVRCQINDYVKKDYILEKVTSPNKPDWEFVFATERDYRSIQIMY